MYTAILYCSIIRDDKPFMTWMSTILQAHLTYWKMASFTCRQSTPDSSLSDLPPPYPHQYFPQFAHVVSQYSSANVSAISRDKSDVTVSQPILFYLMYIYLSSEITIYLIWVLLFGGGNWGNYFFTTGSSLWWKMRTALSNKIRC